MEPHFEKLQGTLKNTSLELRWSFPTLVGVLGYLYIPITPVPYLEYSIDLLAPHPFRMWVAHGLAVHECLLPLVFIFTSLVASDVRDSYKGKQELRLQAARWRGSYFKLWESAQQISDKFPGSYHLSHIEPNLKKENWFPPLSNQRLSWTSASISLRLGSPGTQGRKGDKGEISPLGFSYLPKTYRTEMAQVRLRVGTWGTFSALLRRSLWLCGHLQLWSRAARDLGYNLPVVSGLRADPVLNAKLQKLHQTIIPCSEIVDLVCKCTVTWNTSRLLTPYSDTTAGICNAAKVKIPPTENCFIQHVCKYIFKESCRWIAVGELGSPEQNTE